MEKTYHQKSLKKGQAGAKCEKAPRRRSTGSQAQREIRSERRPSQKRRQETNGKMSGTLDKSSRRVDCLICRRKTIRLLCVRVVGLTSQNTGWIAYIAACATLRVSAGRRLWKTVCASTTRRTYSSSVHHPRIEPGSMEPLPNYD